MSSAMEFFARMGEHPDHYLDPGGVLNPHCKACVKIYASHVEMARAYPDESVFEAIEKWDQQ